MSTMKYNAPPTVARFMRNDAFVRAIMGPVGSGKSTGCLIEVLRRMAEQKPAQDGKRHTRFAIVRQTLQQITQTVLKEFYTWAAPITNYKISEKTIYLDFNDISSEIHLIPLEDAEDQRRLLSMQLTGVWVNEFPEIDPELVPAISGRLGRYPSKAMGGPSWFGMVMDGNFPTEGGPWHKLLELDRPIDWAVFKQPGGLSDAAENVENLPGEREYYERLARSHSPNWVKRYVNAEYGDDPSGSAVFRDSYKASFHCADAVEPAPGHPLLVGLDFGRDPCAIITQMDHRGRLLVLGEIISEGIGLELAIQRNIRPALQDRRYLGRLIALVGDPAGAHKSTSYEETTFDVLKRAGFTGMPAPTNAIDRRLQAVEAFLLQQRDGGPAVLIDRGRCPVLCRGLGGGYRFAKQKNGQLKPVPEKNSYSHVMDAFQYACLAAHNGATGLILSRLTRASRQTRTRPRVSVAGWT